MLPTCGKDGTAVLTACAPSTQHGFPLVPGVNLLWRPCKSPKKCCLYYRALLCLPEDVTVRAHTAPDLCCFVWLQDVHRVQSLAQGVQTAHACCLTTTSGPEGSRQVDAEG
jgi:hypothetical protein